MSVEQEMQGVIEEWSPAIREQGTPEVRICCDTSAGIDLNSLFCEYVKENFSEDGHQCIPLFITPVPSARKSGGLNIASEFVLDALDLPSLSTRIRQLKVVYARGIERGLLRAMCVGAFRKYLFLDDENHGQGEMDFSELINADSIAHWANKDGKQWPRVVIERIKGITGDAKVPRSLRAECYRLLFLQEAQNIESLMQEIIYQIDSQQGEWQS